LSDRGDGGEGKGLHVSSTFPLAYPRTDLPKAEEDDGFDDHELEDGAVRGKKVLGGDVEKE